MSVPRTMSISSLRRRPCRQSTRQDKSSTGCCCAYVRCGALRQCACVRVCVRVCVSTWYPPRALVTCVA